MPIYMPSLNTFTIKFVQVKLLSQSSVRLVGTIRGHKPPYFLSLMVLPWPKSMWSADLHCANICHGTSSADLPSIVMGLHRSQQLTYIMHECISHQQNVFFVHCPCQCIIFSAPVFSWSRPLIMVSANSNYAIPSLHQKNQFINLTKTKHN